MIFCDIQNHEGKVIVTLNWKAQNKENEAHQIPLKVREEKNTSYKGQVWTPTPSFKCHALA